MLCGVSTELRPDEQLTDSVEVTIDADIRVGIMLNRPYMAQCRQCKTT